MIIKKEVEKLAKRYEGAFIGKEDRAIFKLELERLIIIAKQEALREIKVK